MPPEVISLLSSPEPDNPPPPRQPSTNPSYLCTAAATAKPPAPRLGNDSLDLDLFDLSDDFPQLSKAIPSVPIPPNPKMSTKRTYDNLFLSDDFDTTGDIDAVTDRILQDHPSKKRRPSPSLDCRRGRTKGHRDGALSPFDDSTSAAQQQRSGFRRDNAAPYHVDLASSLELGGAPATKPSGPQERDPFLSSPSPPRGKENARRLDKRQSEPDAFVSTPLKPNGPTLSRASAWDPISSSAPEAGSASRPVPRPAEARLLARSRSEVILLDDSDGDGDNRSLGRSSDSEFPDLENIDFSKWKPRVPSVRPGHELPKKQKSTASRSAARRDTASKPSTKKISEDTARQKVEKAAAREAERDS